MSYPVDPSEVYELRREVEDLRREVEAQRGIIAEQGRKRTEAVRRQLKAERTAKEYADANAKALHVIAAFHLGPDGA